MIDDREWAGKPLMTAQPELLFLSVRQSNPEWFDYKPWREGCETDYYYAGRGGRWLQWLTLLVNGALN